MHIINKYNTCTNIINKYRIYFIIVAFFSGLINILGLTSSIYMLQIYDRVLSSHSIPTLVAISIAALWLFIFQTIIDIVRTGILLRISHNVERDLMSSVFRLIVELPLYKNLANAEMIQPLRDLDAVRSFLASSGPVAIFDMPWMPVYLFLIYTLHPTLGLIAISGAALIIILTIATDLFTKNLTRKMIIEYGLRETFIVSASRNAEIIRTMGFNDRMLNLWLRTDNRFLAINRKLNDISGIFVGIVKGLRIILQSAVLGIGAYIVINGEATGGIMLAASVTMSRTLAPVELAISHWKYYLAAKQGAERLDRLIFDFNKDKQTMKLPAPYQFIEVNGLYVTWPGSNIPIIKNISLKLTAGEALGIIGPSAAGKSTLVRALAGVWLPLRGEIRLDGALLDQYSNSELGSYIGYLPQEVELFEGTIAENISRFESNANPDDIIAAAKAANIHTMILKLENGYETKTGGIFQNLSAGQRQLIGLARAIYGNPFIVILDEPNSNLDAEGEEALKLAILNLKARGRIAIIISHRPGVVSAMDWLCVLRDGQIQHLDRKDEVLRILMKKII